MKKIILSVALFLAVTASFSLRASAAPLPATASSSTNPAVMAPLAAVTPDPVLPPAPPTGLGSLGEVGDAAFAFLSDAEPYFGTGNAVQYTALALYNNKHVGGLIAIGTPLTGLSSSGQITAGTALAYIDHQWLSLSLNAMAGTTWDVPLLGKVYTAIGSGPDYNFHSHTPGAYSFAEIFKGWDVGSGHVFSLMGGIGYESSLTGPIYNGGGSLSF